MDRIEQQREIRYGLVNFFVAKFKKPKKPSPDGKDKADESADPAESETDYEYREFLRLGIHRAYDFVEEDRTLAKRSVNLTPDIRRPHKPWEFDVQLDLAPYFQAQAKSEYDIYAEQFTQHTVEVKAWDHRGDTLTMEYEMNMEPFRVEDRELYEYEELRGTVNLMLTEELNFLFEKRYSLLENSDVETVYSLDFHPQCWGVRF